MAKWTDYTTDTNPTDTDEVMTLDADKSPKANKRVTLSTLADYFLDKLASKVFAKLETQNKTVIGALNELNSNKQALLKASGMQFTTDENGIFQTKISKKYNIVSARSNNVIIELFLVPDNDFWNSKAFRLSGEIASNAKVYVTFLYFE